NDPHFDPHYSTIMVAMLDGGTAPYIVPRNCDILWQLRGLPGTKAKDVPKRMERFADETLVPGMREIAPDAGVATTTETSVPAFAASSDSEAVSLAMLLTGANRASGVSYATEAGLFEEAGCPTVVCGPGSIEQAHAADEFVSLEQIDACLEFLKKLTERMST
ncbi:MAG: M20/M25/M40 family metallo-hydrolase, partial [Pseudomonadota bacterium]